jgi:ERF superfamily
MTDVIEAPVEVVDDETGEVIETLSERAVKGIEKPKYWRRVEAIDGEGGPNYEAAFFAAQSEISSMVEADAKNPAFKSRYATLATLLAAVRPALTKHKLTIKQFPGRIHRLGTEATAKQMFLPICTKLTEVSTGEAETFVWEMPLIKVDPQAVSSAATYGKRAAIAGIFGIATVDDDAAASSIRQRIDKDQGADVIDGLIAQIKETKTVADLKRWYALHRDGIEVLSDEKIEKLRIAYGEKQEALQEAEAADPEAAKAGKATKK